MITPSDCIEVKRSPGKGRGVFASRDIKRGEIIETVPLLLIPAKEIVGGIHNKWLGRYYYYWDKKTLAVSLGYGSLYNHSFTPNANYRFRGSSCLIYRALRKISKGEEILIDYHWDEKDIEAMGIKLI